MTSNGEKLNLIRCIVNDTNKESHNKVTEIQMLYDYWEDGKWKGTEEQLIEEYAFVFPFKQVGRR
jgi:hypothetical protein